MSKKNRAEVAAAREAAAEQAADGRGAAMVDVRRILRLVVLVAAIGFVLEAVALRPVLIHFGSDIAYRDAWWVEVLYWLVEEGLWTIIIMAVVYPATIFAIWRVGLRDARRVPIAFACLMLGKFVLSNYIVAGLTSGALQSIGDFLAEGLFSILLMLFLELGQYGLTVLFAARARCRYIERSELAYAEAQLTGRGSAAALAVYPFHRLVALRNPLQGPAFWTAVVLAAGRILNYQILQYTYYEFMGGTDGLWQMLIDLGTSLFLGVLFYFVSLLLFLQFQPKSTTTPRADDQPLSNLNQNEM